MIPKKYINRNIILSTIIILIALASNFKVIDGYVDNYSTKSIKNAAIIYASARGINSLVSMAQTITLEAGMFVSGSVSIGEILDPLNDLIERFSTVMSFVLGALVGIKVLLAISSHDFFNYLITVLAITSVLAIYFNRHWQRELLLKLFVIMIFIRFSLGLMVAFNSVIDHAFLWDEVVKHEQKIEKFRNDLNLDKINKKKANIGYFKNLEKKVETSVSSFFNLMVAFLLKGIIFPLIFFYILFQGIKQVWLSKLVFIGNLRNEELKTVQAT